MSAVGLFYVGAVLFVNGLMLLGRVDPRAAGYINLFVGGLQVIVPTALLIQANGDPAKVLAAAGLYLFGFTYLYVGLNLLTGADSTGAGWYSLFVAITAVGFSAVSFVKLHDAPFGVIWLYWAFLWFLFFLLLGLKRDALGTYTGYVTVVEAWVTATIPGFLLFTGYWRTNTTTTVVLAAFGIVMAAVLWPLSRRRPRLPAPVEADLQQSNHTFGHAELPPRS
ncbi:AmiS/UreI family transporter [Pseudonocardia nigra]|uniref:AmiS/UreI family transporter n=1 Tax=Pseudonocardia nigra TaxID=1921578 RepID=UPI001C5D650F|nr:AmiS/UreI family transporter [Pseudonocardia nigra]